MASSRAMSDPRPEPRRTHPAIVTVEDDRGAPAAHRKSLGDYVFGRRLASDEEGEQQIGPLAGVPVLGLDALSSAAYGPVGALVSAAPSLLPYTLPLCMAILALLTFVNLRGTRESGITFLLPTYLFVASLGAVIVVGGVKTALAGGHPVPLAQTPALGVPTQAASLWLLMRAFASGCTAMTGVEAVSNGVPVFRPPTVKNAERTLTTIIAILVALLGGIALLSRAYQIGATRPGVAGYQSVLSQLTSAVFGRGVSYYVTMGSVVAVLALSANTSFADFPRLCRVLALDRFLPDTFAVRGRRLVFSYGVIVLAVVEHDHRADSGLGGARGWPRPGRRSTRAAAGPAQVDLPPVLRAARPVRGAAPGPPPRS